jgi:hypothetical protein
MASVAKSGTPGLTTAVPPTSCSVSGLIAGENINAGDACYWKASDGKVYRSNGTAANEAARVDGFALRDTLAGNAISLYWNVNIAYGTGLTVGAFYYLDTVAGGLSTVATTGGTVPIAIVLPDGKRIWVRKSY